ncbi:hypothetical protein Tco_1283200 [Tanacetum coccineum]
MAEDKHQGIRVVVAVVGGLLVFEGRCSLRVVEAIEECPDRISKLEDIVLADILSRVTLIEEGVATSVLLELDFYETGFEGSCCRCNMNQYYDFPLPLSDGSMVHHSECPLSSPWL